MTKPNTNPPRPAAHPARASQAFSPDAAGAVPSWRKKPVVIQAHRWFKNGDHPEDNIGRMRPEVEYCEGAVVRYFRHPTIDGKTLCSKCGNAMYGHGWIDTLEDGHNVCPGDWIITGVKGEHYPCKPDIFDLTYEPASTVSETAPLVAGDLAKQREIHDTYAPASATRPKSMDIAFCPACEKEWSK